MTQIFMSGWYVTLMKLGVYLHGSSPFTPRETIQQYLELANHYEAAGIHSLWFADHLIRTPDPFQSPLFEAWSLIAGLTRETSSIRLGTMVSPITFRKFGTFIKQLVTTDHLADGRIIAGLGAGWSFKEYDMFGLHFPPTKARLNMLEEWIQAIQHLWSSPEVTFDGDHVTLHEAYLAPQPVNGNIPILIGGGGEKRTLKLVAKYAQYSNFGGDLDNIAHKLSVLRNHCDNIGRSYDEITPTSNRALVMGRTPDEVDEGIDNYLSRFEEVGRQPPSRDDFATDRLVGTVDEVATQIGQLSDLGIGLVNLTINDDQSSELVPDLVERL